MLSIFRWYHKLIPTFATKYFPEWRTKKKRGLLIKLFLRIFRYLLSYVQIELCLLEAVASHEAQMNLYSLLTVSSTLLSISPFSSNKYSLDMSLQCREVIVSLEMRGDPTLSDVPSLLSLKAPLLVKLCYNALYPTQPLRHFEVSISDAQISSIQKAPEILAGFIKLFFVRIPTESPQLPTTDSSSLGRLSKLFDRLSHWRYFPSCVSLLARNSSVSYVSFGGQALRLDCRQLLLELQSQAGSIRNVSSSAQYRGDRRGTGARLLCRLSGAKLETGSLAHILSLGDLLCEAEVSRHQGRQDELNGRHGSSIKNLAKNKFKKIKYLLWRFLRDSNKDSNEKLYDLSISIDYKSLYLIIDPVLLTNFVDCDQFVFKFDSESSSSFSSLFTSEMAWFASRQVSVSSEDVVVALYLSEPLIRSKEPLLKLAYANAVLCVSQTCHELPAIIFSSQDLYIHTPGVSFGPDQTDSHPVAPLFSKPDSLRVLPASGDHLWGRFFECAKLSVKAELPLVSDRQNPLSASIVATLVNMEFSRDTLFALEWLASPLLALLSLESSASHYSAPICPPLCITSSFQSLNVFLYDINPTAPSLLVHSGSLSCELSHHSMLLTAGEIGLLPIQVEAERFTVSTLANLPQGLFENELLTAAFSWQSKPYSFEFGSEAANVHWSPTKHCHISDSVGAILSQIREAKQFISTRVSFPNESSGLIGFDHQPKLLEDAIEYRSFLGQIRSNFDISCGCKLFNLYILPDYNTRVGLLFQENYACLKSGQLSGSSRNLKISFNKQEIICFDQMLLIRMNHPPPEMSQYRLLFTNTRWTSNYPIAISFQKLTVAFPYKCNVAITIHKLTNILKFLKRSHFPAPADETHLIVPPDLILNAGEIVIDLPDDGFEVKLRDQYELKSDESIQKTQRWLLLNEKIREIKLQEGEMGTSDKIKSLQESLNREDSMVYINRARSFYQSNPIRHWLLRIKLSQSSLTILADPRLQGRANLVSCMEKLNPESPIPEGLEFSILWGRYTKGTVNKFELTLRDYPQPLLTIDELDFQGTVVGAERKGGPLSFRDGSVDIFPPWNSYKLSLNVCPLKFVHDLTAKATKVDFAWGAAYEYAWNHVGEAAEMLYLPTIDPSPPLPFWDRIRIKRHGTFGLSCDKFTLFVLSSKDPYNNTESLVVEMNEFGFLWSACKLHFEGEVSFLVSTASKYDDCRIAYLPRALLDVHMKWLTAADPMDHHSIVPISKFRATPPFSDSYSSFRSSNLDLSFQLDIQSVVRSGKDLLPKFLCYASTIRWLENFKNNVIVNVTRPTRRGTVWYNVRLPKKKLSRHYRVVAFNMSLSGSQLGYWNSYTNRIGVIVRAGALTLDSQFKLSITPFTDGLIHRPRAKFHVSHCEIKTSNLMIDTRSYTSEDNLKVNEFVCIDSISYMYNTTNFNHDSLTETTPTEPNPYRHHIEANKVKLLWNCFNRKLVFSLYESYENNRILRKNLSTEVLRSISLLKKSLQQAALSDYTPVRQENHFPFQNAPQRPSRRILELDRFLELKDKSHSHEDLVRSVHTDEGLYENRWLINMTELQVALCCEREKQSAEGWLLITSAHSFVTGMLNEPRWNRGNLMQKKVWEARINLMQYFASHSFSTAGQVPWLNSPLILGEQSSDDSIYSELLPQDHLLAREQQAFALGAIYSSEAGEDLQRIAYSSYCSVSYSTYHELETDNASDFEVYSSKESLTSSSSLNADTGNSFYLRHPELKVATSSVQYSIVLDIVNNLLLYFESEKKKVSHRYEELRFEIELNNSCNDLDLLLTGFQNRVRTLASKVRTLEKGLYASEHRHKGARPLSGDSLSIFSGTGTRSMDLQAQFSQAKEDLANASLDLKLIIKYIKEVEIMKSSCDMNYEKDSNISTTREVNIWLEEATWTLLQDGQLAIAQIDLGQALYSVTTYQDGSGEHRFELGSLSMTNLLPNTPFPRALSAYDPELSNPKIDHNSSLRIFLKERAPVGGIYVKEHLEVNLVPLAIRLTRRFYKTLFAYFFQQTTSSKNSDLTDGFSATSDGSFDIVSLSGESVNGEDIERMKERAGRNKSFIYIKVPVVPICLSYKGNKDKNIEDVRDLECVFGPLEYHNQIYTWKQLFVRLKKEIKRIVISQAFKRKIGIKKSFDSGLLQPVSNIQEAEKAKLIGVRRSPTIPRKRRKKDKKLAISDSDFSTSVPTDESDQSDFAFSLSESLPLSFNHQQDKI